MSLAMIKKTIASFVFIFLLVSRWFPVSAKDFASFYKTTYRFAGSAEAFVTQEVSLVNQTPDLYVSEYTLSILGGQVDSVEAFDKAGPVKIKTQRKDENTIITLQFNEKVAGRGKVLSFILKYRCGGLAKKEGNLWQISVPKLAKDGDIDEYQLLLKIPTDFGKIAFVNPTPRNEEIVDQYYQLKFDKEDLVNYGVLVTVGQYQTFNFTINYDLYNPSSTSRIEKISLPPDTSYQTLYYLNLQPPPLDLEVDADGNWLALYELSPKQKINVSATGEANLFHQAKKGGWFEPVIAEGDYLGPQTHWQVDHPKIEELAGRLKTAEAIYRYVVDTLTYDYNSIKKGANRRGALAALDDPQHSVCTDFTDLFITLCRAAGIPARELAGFAYTENEKLKELALDNDLLHSWPEYYDAQKKQWIMVDPTWENTSGGLDFFHKFDMSHFVFVTHGQSDTLPFSPGAFKDESSQRKQVFISLGKEDTAIKPKRFSLSQIKPGFIFSLRQNPVEVELVNESGFALHNEIFKIDGFQVEPNEWLFKQIPPFSRFRIGFALKPVEQMKDYQLDLNLSSGEVSLKIPLTVYSLALRATVVLGILLAMALLFLLFSLKKSRSCPPVVENDKLKEG